MLNVYPNLTMGQFPSLIIEFLSLAMLMLGSKYHHI